MMMSGYERIQRFDLEDVLPHIGKPNHNFWIHQEKHCRRVKGMSTQRMLLIKRVQHCEVCHIQGSHFWLERSGCFSPHFNLYAKNHHGHETMLTMDHILPRSKGGSTSQGNIQLLCRHCNKVKKNYLISNDDILRLRLRGDPNFLLGFVIKAYSVSNPDYIPVIHELYANRKKPIVEKDISWFDQFSQQPPSSQCSSSQQTDQPESHVQLSGFVESST